MNPLLDCNGWNLLEPAVRLFLGATWVVAGAFKWRKHEQLKPIVRVLHVPLADLGTRTVAVLPAAEIALGLWIIAGLWARVALAVALVLWCGFTLVMFLAARRGYQGSCGCFGALTSRQLNFGDFVRNLLLAAAAIEAIGASYVEDSCMAVSPWNLPPAVILVSSGMLAALMLVYILMSEVFAFLGQREI